MKFNSTQEAHFKSRSGAWSVVTPREHFDSQITLDADETQVILDILVNDDILVGNVRSAPERARKEVRLYPSGGRIHLNLVYPKPGNNELRLYLSEDAGFKPFAGDIWFIFNRGSEVWIGSMPQCRWDSRGIQPRQVDPAKAIAGAGIFYKDFGEAPNDDLNDLQQFARRVRRGQRKFRRNLLNEYEYQCSIVGHGPEQVLEAVHIIPHADLGINEIDNGLLMRSDLHDLFDDHLLGIQPETLVVCLKPELQMTDYRQLDGRPLRPRRDGKHPSIEYLLQRWDMFTGETSK